jgi:hypothetical protein
MPVTATVSAGWTFTTGDTVTASNLNALGLPSVTVPDGKDFVFGAGTVGAPSISFTGDTNTGIAQLAGAGTLSVVTDGVEAFRFINDQALAMPGADATPAYSFAGDSNTGINRDTPDELDIVCGGSRIVSAYVGGIDVVGNVEADSVTVNGAVVLTAGINTGAFVYYTDFTGPLASTAFTSAVVATGAVAQVTSRSTDTDHRGLISFSVAAVSDRAVIHLPAQIKVGGSYRVRMRLAQLSAPSDRFFVMIGLTNNTTDTISSVTGNGAWFQYIDSASAQWQTVTMDAGTKETQTTDVTVAAGGTWYTLTLYRAGASDYRFYVDGVLKTTHTTSVESGIDFNYFAFIMEKTVGSTAVVAYIDSFEISNPLARV